jgi:phage terminase large subunit GpA-like protein
VKDVTTLFKSFPGGFIKFVGSNSIADVKSTSARRLIIEEPDDCNLNLRGQGDSIKLLEERGKTFRDLKILVGGTPSMKGRLVDRRRVRGLRQDALAGAVPALRDAPGARVGAGDLARQGRLQAHPVTATRGPTRRATAARAAAPCGTTPRKTPPCRRAAPRRRRVPRRGRPRAERALQQLLRLAHAGPGRALPHRQARGGQGRARRADHVLERGARAVWEFKSDLPDEDKLAERGLDYEPMTVPAGGLLLTMGVDVQHDRLAVILRAYGRGEESWLVLFDEIPGRVVDRDDEVWTKARRDRLRAVSPRLRHLDAGAGRVDRLGDGVTADAVYHWVRSRLGRANDAGVLLMAIKGSTDAKGEIFAKPRSVIDTNRKNTKASKHGLAPFMVGVSRAKDLLLGDMGGGRLKLEGEGPARFHWYRSVRADYLEQLTSEVKVPLREIQGSGAMRKLATAGALKRVWVMRRGRRNEALDARSTRCTRRAAARRTSCARSTGPASRARCARRRSSPSPSSSRRSPSRRTKQQSYRKRRPTARRRRKPSPASRRRASRSGPASCTAGGNRSEDS